MKTHSPKYFFCLLFTIIQFNSFAQNYVMDGSPITDCTGFFQDSGGNDSYGTDESLTTTICSDQSIGTHIQLVFSSIDLGTGDSLHIYDANTADPDFLIIDPIPSIQTNPFIVQASVVNTSGCLTLVFSSNNIDDGNQGWNADINCIPSCQNILANADISPQVMPVDTGWVDICLGDLISFSGNGIYPQNEITYTQADELSVFEWDFGDGTTAFGLSNNHVYQEAGGYIVQLKITDQFGCINTNYISQRIRVIGSSNFVVDDSLPDSLCNGELLVITTDTSSNASINIHPGEWTFNQAQSISNPLLLPDGTGAVYEESISFNQAAAGDTISNAEEIIHIAVSMEHSYSGDLDIEIICPNGSAIFLLDYPSGLGSTNFGEPFANSPVDGVSSNTCIGIPYNYYFVNEATNGTLVQFDPFAPTYTYTTTQCDIDPLTYTYSDTYFPEGEYQPQESFENLIGCPINGDWSIRIQDNLFLDNGWITQWSIVFADSLFPNIETYSNEIVNYGWEEEPSIILATPDSLLASVINPGVAEYTFWAEDNFGCTSEVDLSFNILPDTHPNCVECDIQINEQTDITICEGDTTILSLPATIELEECITFQRFPNDSIGAGNHSPATPYRNALNINNLSNTMISNPITDICSVCLSFDTDFNSDISLFLQSPNNTILPLFFSGDAQGIGGFVDMCFTPSSLVTIDEGEVPFTGNFQIVDSTEWNSLIGSPINGEWTLIVSDVFGILNSGNLSEWSISFNEKNEYDYTWTPATDLSCSTCDTTEANPSTTTTYTVAIEDNYGCTLDQEITVEVLLADHPDCMPLQTNHSIYTDLLIWPNPAASVLNVELPNSAKRFSSIKMYNALGEIVPTPTINYAQSSAKLDISHLTNGVYYLLIKAEDNLNAFMKVVKM